MDKGAFRDQFGNHGAAVEQVADLDLLERRQFAGDWNGDVERPLSYCKLVRLTKSVRVRAVMSQGDRDRRRQRHQHGAADQQQAHLPETGSAR